jgi:hypothetical protein
VVLLRLSCMIDFAAPAPSAPLSPLGASLLPPPVAAPAAPAPRRRRTLPVVLGVLAVLGVAGTVAASAAAASSGSRNADLARANDNLSADLDDADAEILRLERQLGDAERQITDLEGDLTDSSATVLTLQRDLAVAEAELSAAQSSAPDLPAAADVPWLNDGVVSTAEAGIIAEQAARLGFGGAVLETAQYQEIADRACAAETVVELNVVAGWMRSQYPQLTMDGAGFLTGGTAGAACQAHLYDVLGI